MKKNPRDYLALALDNVNDLSDVSRLLEQTKPFFGMYKIGLELFTRFGPAILDSVRLVQRRIFLDLKFHDIPNTVAQAVLSASRLGVDLCTLHTFGGKAMMAAAVTAAEKAREDGFIPPKLIGVTVLTSIDDASLKNDLRVALGVQETVRHLAHGAVAAGLNGVVCSAVDLPFVKKDLPETFEVVTPGIRRLGSNTNDQKRVATPAQAIANGATVLVIGRDVTLATDPAAAAAAILAELSLL
jgi:orotidine-5'-phosphate decarboxylase